MTENSENTDSQPEMTPEHSSVTAEKPEPTGEAFLPQENTADAAQNHIVAEEHADKNEDNIYEEKISDEEAFFGLNIGNEPLSYKSEPAHLDDIAVFDEPEIIVSDADRISAETFIPEDDNSDSGNETNRFEPLLESDRNSHSEGTENTASHDTENHGSAEFAVEAPDLHTDDTTEKITLPPEQQGEPADTETDAAAEQQDAFFQEENQHNVDDSAENETAYPSRSVSIKINQYLDAVYPGTGWIYIGESEKAPLLGYFGRKLGTENTTFSLRARKPGNTVLHFYKNDALTGKYIDDYLEVIVEDEKSTGRVEAPLYADIIPAKPAKRTTAIYQDGTALQSENSSDKNTAATDELSEKKESKTNAADSTQNGRYAPSEHGETDGIKTVIQTTTEKPQNAMQEPAPPEKSAEQTARSFEYVPEARAQEAERSEQQMPVESAAVRLENNGSTGHPDTALLEQAQLDFSNKNYEQALEKAQAYIDRASERLDEALFLLGQIFEADSPVKNIRSSIDSYDAIVKNYPASRFWKHANQRSIYLKRFYIDIR